MNLKNEIFEGLGAATAAKKLVYDPRDDYYDAIADAAKSENARRKQQEKERIENKSAATGAPVGSTVAPAAAGVPTAASVHTPQAPTVPGVPPAPVAPGPTASAGWGTSYPPGAVEPPGLFQSRARRGGAIKAIRTNYRHGGPVTPYDDDEGPQGDIVPQIPMMPHMERGPSRGQGTPRNPRLPPPNRPGASKRDPAWLQGPYLADDDELEDLADPGQLSPFDARARRYAAGGAVDDDQSAVDTLIAEALQNSGADALGAQQRRYGMGNVGAVQGYDNRPGPQAPSETDERIAAERAPNTRARQGSAIQIRPPSFEGSPNIVPPLSRYTPPPLTGSDEPRERTSPPRSVNADDAARIEAEGVPNVRARAVSPEPPPPVRGTEFGAQEGMPEVERSSKLGRAIPRIAMPRDTEQSRSLNEINRQINELVAERQRVDPGLLQQTTPGERQRAEQRIVEIDQQIQGLIAQRSQVGGGQPPTVGAGTGLGGGDQQVAARATGPTGTTQPPAPPVGGAGANTPTTAPKSGVRAMRPDLPNWNPLGMDLRATAAGPGGGGAGGGQPAAPPARLPMSDPNRVAAYDPSNPEDVNDPTRRRTNEELAQVLVGATTQMPLGPNGQLPVVGQGAASRHVGQAYVARYNQGGRWEPGEAILRGMLSDYKTYLSQGRLEDANKMAAGLIQYANLEAASHAHVAEAAVKAGDFYGALRNVVAAASYLPDGMSHAVGADGKSVDTIDPRTGKVTANTPVDGRWLLAAIGGFKNGDLLWQTLSAAATSLQKTDKNAEGRALSNLIRRNTLKLQGQRLAKGAGGKAGPPGLTETEKRLAQIAANLSGSAPPGTESAAQPAVAQGSSETDEVNPPLDD